jgi:hypothetical protein
MSVDRYTKVVLTVIAVCLVWLSLGGPSLTIPVQAQGGRQVEIKRVNVGAGATTQTLGVPVGISCLELGTEVGCFVVSTR